MFCKHCGKEFSDGQKFCKYCGTSLSGSTNKSESHEDQKFGSPQTIPKQTNYKNIIIRIVVIGAFIALGAYESRDDTVIKVNNTAIESFDSGNSQQAITELREASQTADIDENKVTTLKNLAYVYSSESQDVNALNTFKQALQLTTAGSFDYHLITGEIALLEKKPKDALLSYNKAYQMKSDDFQINNALALFYLDLTNSFPEYVDYPKALKYALRASELTDLQAAKENLAIAYYYNKNYDKAISLFSSFDYNKQPVLAYWLGLCYAEKSDEVNAKLYFKKAISGGADVPKEILEYVNS